LEASMDNGELQIPRCTALLAGAVLAMLAAVSNSVTAALAPAALQSFKRLKLHALET
jgi:hypothetical protein